MEQMRKYRINRKKLIKAYSKLKEALNEKDFNEYIQDSIIQRFEFTFELLWKTLKFYLLIQGFEENTPRNVLKKSFEIGLLNDIDIFLDMIENRNLTSHTYDENLAEEVHDFIKENFGLVGELIEKLPEEL